MGINAKSLPPDLKWKQKKYDRDPDAERKFFAECNPRSAR
jgi:hypothetical protein